MSSTGHWPWHKLAKRVGEDSGKIPAVLVSSGHFSPTHLGHTIMMHQAEKRLVRMGYDVIGAWLSPSHDLSVLADAKARGAPELRADFRIKLAELSTLEDDLVAVSSWEARQNKVSTDREVAVVLHEAVNKEYGHLFSRDVNIRVFVVCGCDHAVQFKLNRGMQSSELGVVIVPRDNTEEVLLEKSTSLVYVADSCPDSAAALSATKLREAICSSDREYVERAMTSHAARFILQPTSEDLQAMRIDFENLHIINPALDIIAQDGPWPLAKLQDRLSQCEETDHPAVVIVSGSMSPAHHGFFEIMKTARERLERAGYIVVGGFLSPQNATGAAMEMRSAAGSEEETALSTGFRLKCTKLATSQDDFISLGAWEASVTGRVPTAEEVICNLSSYLADNIPGMKDRRVPLSTFYACGPGQAARRNLTRSVDMQYNGVVIVPCENEDCFLLEKPSNLFYVADARAGEANIVVSAKIRAAVQAGNAAYVRSVCNDQVSRFVLFPTEEEKAAMKADYDFLHPVSAQLDGGTAMDESKAKFKAVLRAWAGPSGVIAIEDISRVLEVLDPSWTNSELTSFTSGAFGAVSKDGKIATDSLVDWMFNTGQKSTSITWSGNGLSTDNIIDALQVYGQSHVEDWQTNGSENTVVVMFQSGSVPIEAGSVIAIHDDNNRLHKVKVT